MVLQWIKYSFRIDESQFAAKASSGPTIVLRLERSTYGENLGGLDDVLASDPPNETS
jgi:hypothetical protein